ncbi:hypothetical protein [Streptomyces sp. NRRL S-646]|uniref:hypothetical protein n=1 Tax=Streptomyces sp. NRRL S-646 TaxID=1463917 RepID=UPI001331A493|nr:hypothetical protein [Streptomyces sp. NRRL S-646]
MSELEAYRIESPGPIDYGFFLHLEWHVDSEQIESLIEIWRRRAEECISEVARAEWHKRIRELRAFLAEGSE